MNVFERFKEQAEKSGIVCHGAGNNAYSMLNNEDFGEFRERILFFVDGDDKKVGSSIGSGNNEFEIKNISEVPASNDFLVIVTISDYESVGEYYSSKGISWYSWIELAVEFAFSHVVDAEDKRSRFFLLNTPDYLNMGDHAITIAEKEYLKKYDRDIYEFGSSICNEKGIPRLRKKVRPGDILFIQGGGNMGSLWRTCEDNIRRIIGSFRENSVIVFPQSIYYESGDDNDNYFDQGRLIYDAHPDLYLCMRDAKSYSFAASRYSCESLLIPDMVLLLNERKNDTVRTGVGLLLRDDKEKALKEDYVFEIERAISGCGMQKKIISHHSKELLGDRRDRLERTLDVYRSCRLVITDRLHGMIFSVITGTPCIVFDNSYGKVSSLYETWLKQSEYVTVTSEIKEEELAELIKFKSEMKYSGGSDLSDKYIALDSLIERIVREKENEHN